MMVSEGDNTGGGGGGVNDDTSGGGGGGDDPWRLRRRGVQGESGDGDKTSKRVVVMVMKEGDDRGDES